MINYDKIPEEDESVWDDDLTNKQEDLILTREREE